jgi:hypothetical protein
VRERGEGEGEGRAGKGRGEGGKKEGRKTVQARLQWLTPVILATQEAEIRRMEI